VLGSATPALESYRNAKSDKYGLAVLPERVDNQKMPHMEVVDMRIEAQRNGGKPCAFSNSLINAMRDRLEKAEQTMLFLNRRGYASSFMCPQCGYVAQCGNCSVSMTCHTQDDTLKCHICGDVRKLPGRCPECGDEAYRMAGIGTQRVEKIVGKLFPQARVQRMDSDSTTAKNSHQKILGEFRTGRIDILVGTQMIAKGLHFPNVTLIGVIYADMGLHMPDFRAGERTFQLLTQVAGRAGRGEVSGLVVVQTYTPFHPAIQAARRLDFPAFYDQEIEFRKELSYPPFTRLVCITLRSKSAERASFLAETLAKAIEPHLPESAIIAGPAPAPIEKARGYYRVQIILRARSVGKMVEAIRTAVKNIKWPSDVTYAIDVDATSLL
jgi:primosomal protein N' (replication factor Y)